MTEIQNRLDTYTERTPERYEEISMEMDAAGKPDLKETIFKHMNLKTEPETINNPDPEPVMDDNEESAVNFAIHLEEKVETIKIKAVEFHFDDVIEELILRAQKMSKKQTHSLRKQLHENYMEPPTGMESEALINDVNYHIHEIFEG